MARPWSRSLRGGEASYRILDLEAQLSSQEFLSAYRHSKLASALKNRRLILISRNPELWVYMGRTRDYLVIPRTYCSCRDFLVNTVGRMKPRPCYHLVAQVLAEKNNLYRDLTWMQNAWIVVEEILDHEFSRTLRKAVTRTHQNRLGGQ